MQRRFWAECPGAEAAGDVCCDRRASEHIRRSSIDKSSSGRCKYSFPGEYVIGDRSSAFVCRMGSSLEAGMSMHANLTAVHGNAICNQGRDCMMATCCWPSCRASSVHVCLLYVRVSLACSRNPIYVAVYIVCRSAAAQCRRRQALLPAGSSEPTLHRVTFLARSE